MSSSNISPIHGCGSRPDSTSKDRRTSPPSARQDRTGPAAAVPSVRPASGRSAMDLYAAIHESKKRLLGQQPAAEVAVTAVRSPPGTAIATALRSPPRGPAVTAVRSPPRGTAVTTVIRSPDRQSDRYRPRDDRSATYDFKRLLLQTNMAGGRRAQQSAVVRLQQRQPAQPPTSTLPRTAPVVAGRRIRGGAPWKSDVLSSTIPEDCREDEYGYDFNGSTAFAAMPKSSALVNRTLKSFAAAAAAPDGSTCSALETAL